MPAAIDLVGKRFGRLVVDSLEGSRGGKRYWNCLCDCGRMSTVSGSNLGRCILSCGCLREELSHTQKHGRRHGMKGTPEYAAWNAMRSRCNNPRVKAYKNYGGRGITVDPRWDLFENFLVDMGRKPSPNLELDRTDNDGNYEPGNCRWTTRSVNVSNTRPRLRRANGQWEIGGVEKNSDWLLAQPIRAAP